MTTGVRLWSAALLAVAAAGCDGGEPRRTAPGEPAQTASPAGAANPDAPPGIALADARVQLPAVAGRPGVAYLTIRHSGGAARSIVAVHVAGAGRSELHATAHEGGVSRMAPLAQVPLGPGETVRFAPGGNHVMLFELDPTLKPGGTSEVTVVFADGDKATIRAPVTSAAGSAR